MCAHGMECSLVLCTCTLYVFSVSGFEFTSESGLFDLFDVVLYHGWLVDPQDEETYQVVSHYSYNQLVEMVVNNSNSNDLNKAKNGEYASCFMWHGTVTSISSS